MFCFYLDQGGITLLLTSSVPEFPPHASDPGGLRWTQVSLSLTGLWMTPMPSPVSRTRLMVNSAGQWDTRSLVSLLLQVQLPPWTVHIFLGLMVDLEVTSDLSSPILWEPGGPIRTIYWDTDEVSRKLTPELILPWNSSVSPPLLDKLLFLWKSVCTGLRAAPKGW
jgi:hypothetical protein